MEKVFVDPGGRNVNTTRCKIMLKRLSLQHHHVSTIHYKKTKQKKKTSQCQHAQFHHICTVNYRDIVELGDKESFFEHANTKFKPYFS